MFPEGGKALCFKVPERLCPVASPPCLQSHLSFRCIYRHPPISAGPITAVSFICSSQIPTPKIQMTYLCLIVAPYHYLLCLDVLVLSANANRKH